MINRVVLKSSLEGGISLLNSHDMRIYIQYYSKYQSQLEKYQKTKIVFDFFFFALDIIHFTD